MRTKREEVIEAILELLAAEKTSNPSRMIQDNFRISRQQLARYFSYLVSIGLIEKIGEGRATTYRLASAAGHQGAAGKKVIFRQSFLVSDLRQQGEDQIYRQLIEKQLAHLRNNVRSIAHHAITEMLNNVIDHSQAEHAHVAIIETADWLQISISDDGIGIFEKNRQAYSCSTLFEAVAETAKGKRTSQPEAHAGEGIFFTSRLADRFILEANKIRYIYVSTIDDWTLEECERITAGTTVQVWISSLTTRLPEDVFARYTDANYAFTKGGRFLVSPYEISMSEEPVSRSEARRVLTGAEKFQHILLDFKNSRRVGQGFADEIFRVFQSGHPELTIEPINMNPAVAFMIRRAQAQS